MKLKELLLVVIPAKGKMLDFFDVIGAEKYVR